MPDCPHCTKEITHLSGFVSQADHEERLNSLRTGKDTEITALSTEVTTLRTKNSGHDAIVAERDALKASATARDQMDARTGLLTADDAKVDPALLPHFEMIYDASQAGKADADKATFAAWFASDAKQHVLLSDKFGQGTAAATAAATAATGTDAAAPAAAAASAGSGVSILGNANGAAGSAAAPPGPGGRLSEQDVQAIFKSPEYLAMDKAGKIAKVAEVKQLVAQQQSQPAA